MSIFIRKQIPNQASILIWKIEETETQLLEQVFLHPSDQNRFNRISHERSRIEFLALRCCLKDYYGENPEVYYEETGKPYTKNGDHISFTHTRGFAGVIISKTSPVGIDLELHRDQILRIAHKFISPREGATIKDMNRIEHLTFYWGAKEVAIKITGNHHLSFIEQLQVMPFDYKPCTSSSVNIYNTTGLQKAEVHFEKIEELSLSYGWLKTEEASA